MHTDQSPFSKYPELSQLMETGEPVCVTFETEHEIGRKVGSKVGHEAEKSIERKNKEIVAGTGDEKFPEKSNFLFCELVQKARLGEAFLISGQNCSPGDYVLGFSEKSPAAY